VLFGLLVEQTGPSPVSWQKVVLWKFVCGVRHAIEGKKGRTRKQEITTYLSMCLLGSLVLRKTLFLRLQLQRLGSNRPDLLPLLVSVLLSYRRLDISDLRLG